MVGREQLSRRNFYALGGPANQRLFRRARRGVWTYWRLTC